MNKQSIIGFILIFGILVGYMYWVSPSKEEIAERMRVMDSTRRADSLATAQADSIALAQATLDSLAQQGDTEALAAIDAHRRVNLGAFTISTTGNPVDITVKNEVMQVAISNMGAQVKQVILNRYTTYDSLPLTLITPSNDNLNLVFSTEDNRVVNTKDLVFTPYQVVDNREVPLTENSTFELAANESVDLALRAYVGDSNGAHADQYLEFRYHISGSEYDVEFDINFHNINHIVRNTPYMDLAWHNSMNRQEKVDKSAKGSRNRNKDAEKFNSNVYYKPSNDKVDQLKLGRDDDKQVKTSVEWIAYKQQFFCAILMSDSNAFENAELSSLTTPNAKDDRYLCDMSSTVGITYENNSLYSMNMRFFFGPTKYKDLRAMHKGFERMLPLGWGFFLTQWISRYAIIPVFNFLEKFNWNYGIIIIVLTFLMRLVLFPLTFKSYQGSAIMRILKPEMDALSKKYPNQDQMMQKQQEMARLQKRAGYSPMAGCLPLLLQMPIIWAMFRFYPASIELRQQSFLWCDDLSTYDSILDLGFNIPLYGDHVSLFCLLMFGVQFFYTWYMMKSQDTSAMPGMKFMMYFTPFMMLFLFNSQSAALNLYYFCSLSITMAQMILIRKFTNEKKVRARMAAYDAKQKKGGPQKKSKFQQRLEEMQKMTEEMQRQQRAQQSRK